MPRRLEGTIEQTVRLTHIPVHTLKNLLIQVIARCVSWIQLGCNNIAIAFATVAAKKYVATNRFRQTCAVFCRRVSTLFACKSRDLICDSTIAVRPQSSCVFFWTWKFVNRYIAAHSTVSTRTVALLYHLTGLHPLSKLIFVGRQVATNTVVVTLQVTLEALHDIIWFQKLPENP